MLTKGIGTVGLCQVENILVLEFNFADSVWSQREIMETVSEGVRCVSCNILNPTGGKLLHCLHVICSACLSDSISHPGCVKCMLCRHITTPKHHGAGIGKQLASISILLEGPSAESSQGESENRKDGELNCCSYCADVDLEREAVVECVECNGGGGALLSLCAAHNTRHAQSTGHHVREISTSSHGKPDNTKPVCLLHPKYNVVKYCHTCNYCVCERCVDKGHSGHGVEWIPATARKQRSLLRGIVQTKTAEGPVLTSSEDNLPKSLPITAQLSVVVAEIEEITGQAEHASEKITETFDKIAEAVEKKKMEMLDEIDKKSWKLLEPLQLRREQLQVLQQQEDIAVRLAERLSKEDSCDTDVLDVSSLVEECFKKLGDNVPTEGKETSSARISVKITDSMERLQEDLSSVLSVQCEEQLDLSRCEIILPEEITTNAQNVIEMRPPRAYPQDEEEETYCPTIKCHLVSKDGTACKVLVEIKNSDHQQPVITITAYPEVAGDHILTIHFQGKSRSVKFEAVDAVARGVRLDPAKCSPEITLSNTNRMATLTGREGHRCVLSDVGYSSGIHKWSVRVHACEVTGNSYYIAAGVCAAAISQKYNGKEFPCPNFYWRSTGEAKCRGSGKNSTAWANDDLVTFTLNFNTKTLQLHLHRTDEDCVIDGLDCNQPLYPAIYLYSRGHQAELCQPS